MKLTALSAGPLALLAGCAGSAGPCPPVAPPVITQLPDDDCGATRFEHLVGTRLTPAIRTEITAGRGDHGLRFIAPGDAVTQDFRTDRLNVTLDDRGRIARLYCG